MSPLTAVAVYLVIWWVTLFAILPLGARSHAEEGIELRDGGDPGSPVTPNLKRKFITTSWVAAIVWLIAMGVMISGVVKLPGVPE